MKWGQAAAKLEAAMKGNKKESEMSVLTKELYVVVFPDAHVDFFLSGVFDNLDAAQTCASDPCREYAGVVFVIRPEAVQSSYMGAEEEV